MHADTVRENDSAPRAGVALGQDAKKLVPAAVVQPQFVAVQQAVDDLLCPALLLADVGVGRINRGAKRDRD